MKTINRKEFKSWLESNYPDLSSKTIPTIVNEAFYMERHNLNITFDQILSGEITRKDYLNAISLYFINNGKKPGSEVYAYTAHIQYLLTYINSLDPNSHSIKGWNLSIEDKGKAKQDKKKITFKKVKDVHPSPSPKTISEFVKEWDSIEEVTAKEASIRKLFTITAPSNKDIVDILIKIATLNDFYSTNIFNVYLVAKHFATLNLDKRLQQGYYDPNLVEEMANVPGIKAKLYSFATKYCSHNVMDEYPIYDSFVDKMLRYFRDKDSFSTFNNNDLKDYNKFRYIIFGFMKYYNLQMFSLKELDKYLWLAGKQYFPR